MAMNAFIRKPQPEPVQTPAIAPNTVQPVEQKRALDEKRLGAADIAKAQTTGIEIAVMPEPEIQKDGVAKFSEQEANTLKALSALQIKYGHAGEAIPYLMMLRKTNPDDFDAARLLAKALMKLGSWEQADVILAELETAAVTRNDDEAHGLVLLYRSIAAFKTRRLAEARNWLARFRARIAGGSS